MKGALHGLSKAAEFVGLLVVKQSITDEETYRHDPRYLFGANRFGVAGRPLRGGLYVRGASVIDELSREQSGNNS